MSWDGLIISSPTSQERRPRWRTGWLRRMSILIMMVMMVVIVIIVIMGIMVMMVIIVIIVRMVIGQKGVRGSQTFIMSIFLQRFQISVQNFTPKMRKF